MTETDNGAVVERFMHALASSDVDAYESTLAEDSIAIYPQSGERFRGRANLRALMEQFRRDEPFRADVERVPGDEPSWVMSPGFRALRVGGSGEHFTATGRVRYANGEEWHLVQLIDVRDGRIRQVISYFAEPFEAPDWRAPYREPLEA
ncbi:MAG: nuclear transport factor 2 family protein [Candidatus Limnocylindria bacterium]